MASLRIADLPSPSLNQIAQSIHSACLTSDLDLLRQLLSSASDLLTSLSLQLQLDNHTHNHNQPVEVEVEVPWCDLQDKDGYTALHCAAEGGKREVVECVLREGKAHWAITDDLGNTAGDVAFSLNNAEVYELLLEEAIRAELLRSLLSPPSPTPSPPLNADADISTASGPKPSTASDNKAFLSSKLRFVTSSTGQKTCLDEEGNGVMMGWESGIMRVTAERLCRPFVERRLSPPPAATSRPPEGVTKGLSILNVGFGLGIVNACFQSYRPERHVIVEPHPDVLEYLESEWLPSLPPLPSPSSSTPTSTTTTSLPSQRSSSQPPAKRARLSTDEKQRLLAERNIEIFPGRWQDFLSSVEAGDIQGGFSVVYWDTFSEDYAALKEFVEELPSILAPPRPGGEGEAGVQPRWSFFHGLGATSRLLYDLHTSLLSMHLRDNHFKVGWEEVEELEGVGSSGCWEGVKEGGRYWSVSGGYRLGVCSWDV